jgi:hypothetical protein
MSGTDSKFQGYGTAASQWQVINSFYFKSYSILTGFSPAVLDSVDNVANIVNSGVTNISDAISEQQHCEHERPGNVSLLNVLQRQNAPKSLTGCRQSIFSFAKQIFPMCGSQEPADGCLQIHTFKSGNQVQEEHFGVREFVRAYRSSSTSTSNSSTRTAGAGKTVLACDSCWIIVHLLIILT